MNLANVLVVEDDLPLAREMAYLLAPLQVQTTLAGSLREARKCLAERRYDVAVLDLMLPDGDGVGLLSEVKERSPGTELVIVTGNPTVASATAAVRNQVVDYVEKPFEPRRLVESVRLALARHGEHRPGLSARRRDERIAAVGTLAAGLAHHLRNPLNSALLELEVARRRAEPTVASLVALAGAELRRLERILHEFETCLARSAVLVQETFVDELWSSVVAQVLGAAAANHVEIRSELAPDLGSIRVDRCRLGTALAHLARNAIEAMESGGTLTFRARRCGTTVELEVEDTGCGIPHPEAVFDAFYTTKPTGTGLGLTIAHKTVIDHGGTIRVASHPGCTGFVISLPHASDGA